MLRPSPGAVWCLRQDFEALGGFNEHGVSVELVRAARRAGYDRFRRNPEPPLSVIEFQIGEHPQIYTRTVQKRAAVQQEFYMREGVGDSFARSRAVN